MLHVITPLGINFLVTQNTKFAITLLENFVIKYFFLEKKTRRVGYLMVGFCNFAKFQPEKVISNLNKNSIKLSVRIDWLQLVK